MSLFTYAAAAPVASVTLRLAGAPDRDVTFHPGAVLDLPADHAYVVRLVARGLLTAAPAAPAAPPARGAKTPAPTTPTE